MAIVGAMPPRPPLPGCNPKPSIDDPESPARVERLMASPSYLRADCDLAFLNREDMRHSRLALEYLKAEVTLQEQGVDSTIVLFGGTRIIEPAAAKRAVEENERKLQESPNDATALRQLAISRRIAAKSHYYDVAREFAALVSKKCCRDAANEFVIVTGGGPGVMEAGNRGAFDENRKTAGFNIDLPMEQFPNPYISPELCLQFRYFAMRKFHFLKRAKALVAFPGGYGTLDELFDALCLVQTGKIAPMPIVLVGESFWRRAFDANFLVDEGVIAPDDVDLFSYAETADAIWERIQDHHANQDAGE